FGANSQTFSNDTQFLGSGESRVTASAAFNDNITADNLLLAGGTFTGTPTFSGTRIDWSGGTIDGAFTTAGIFNIISGTTKTIANGRTFTNNGTLNLSQGDTFTLYDGTSHATLDNFG